MRKPLIAGNWKMNKDQKQAAAFATELVSKLGVFEGRDALLIPPFTAIAIMEKALKGSKILLGAQNMHAEKGGAYTGEISADMLLDAGCRFVVIGHSERRQYFCENNHTCNLKIKAAVAAGLVPIYCIGETLNQRESGITSPLIEVQVREGLFGMAAEDVKNMVLAYEPVWAIGTGMTATPDQAQEIHQGIRKVIKNIFDFETAQSVRIQYGGSVKPDNVDTLMGMPDIDGALVGGASMQVDSFARIVQFK